MKKTTLIAILLLGGFLASKAQQSVQNKDWRKIIPQDKKLEQQVCKPKSTQKHYFKIPIKDPKTLMSHEQKSVLVPYIKKNNPQIKVKGN